MNAEFKIVCGDAEKISRVLDKMMCRLYKGYTVCPLIGFNYCL